MIWKTTLNHNITRKIMGKSMRIAAAAWMMNKTGVSIIRLKNLPNLITFQVVNTVNKTNTWLLTKTTRQMNKMMNLNKSQKNSVVKSQKLRNKMKKLLNKAHNNLKMILLIQTKWWCKKLTNFYNQILLIMITPIPISTMITMITNNIMMNAPLNINNRTQMILFMKM